MNIGVTNPRRTISISDLSFDTYTKSKFKASDSFPELIGACKRSLSILGIRLSVKALRRVQQVQGVLTAYDSQGLGAEVKELLQTRAVAAS
jgi:hypothetical protein